MKKLLYITVCMIFNAHAAHKLENVSHATADSLEQQLELATITLSFESMPSVQEVATSNDDNGFNHVRYVFTRVTFNDAVQKALQELVQHRSQHYYITYQISPDGIMLDLYYDPRYVAYRINNNDGINLEYRWVLHVYNAVLLDMYQHDDKPLIQFAYYSHDKYKTSCFLV